jgi:hypothetical protein
LPHGMESSWHEGVVVGYAFPGIWVQTEEGARWFVTNRRRIRPVESGGKVDGKNSR